jgi:hypothetical protein
MAAIMVYQQLANADAESTGDNIADTVPDAKFVH